MPIKRRKPLRSEILQSLGFNSYSEYLASDLWKSIRARVLDKADHKCRRCEKPATQVHHRSYCLAAMVGQDLSLLVACCSGCHKMAEFHANGTKAQRSVANRKLDGTYDSSARHRSRPWIGRMHAARQAAKRRRAS